MSIGVPVTKTFNKLKKYPFETNRFDRREPNEYFYVPVDCPRMKKCDDAYCPLAHTKLEKIFHPIVYKTQVCQMAKNGTCEYFEKCAFFHDNKDKYDAYIKWTHWEKTWEKWRNNIDNILTRHNKNDKEIKRKVESILKVRMSHGPSVYMNNATNIFNKSATISVQNSKNHNNSNSSNDGANGNIPLHKAVTFHSLDPGRITSNSSSNVSIARRSNIFNSLFMNDNKENCLIGMSSSNLLNDVWNKSLSSCCLTNNIDTGSSKTNNEVPNEGGEMKLESEELLKKDEWKSANGLLNDLCALNRPNLEKAASINTSVHTNVNSVDVSPFLNKGGALCDETLSCSSNVTDSGGNFDMLDNNAYKMVEFCFSQCENAEIENMSPSAKIKADEKKKEIAKVLETERGDLEKLNFNTTQLSFGWFNSTNNKMNSKHDNNITDDIDSNNMYNFGDRNESLTENKSSSFSFVDDKPISAYFDGVPYETCRYFSNMKDNFIEKRSKKQETFSNTRNEDAISFVMDAENIVFDLERTEKQVYYGITCNAAALNMDHDDNLPPLCNFYENTISAATTVTGSTITNNYSNNKNIINTLNIADESSVNQKNGLDILSLKDMQKRECIHHNDNEREIVKKEAKSDEKGKDMSENYAENINEAASYNKLKTVDCESKVKCDDDDRNKSLFVLEEGTILTKGTDISTCNSSINMNKEVINGEMTKKSGGTEKGQLQEEGKENHKGNPHNSFKECEMKASNEDNVVVKEETSKIENSTVNNTPSPLPSDQVGNKTKSSSRSAKRHKNKKGYQKQVNNDNKNNQNDSKPSECAEIKNSDIKNENTCVKSEKNCFKNKNTEKQKNSKDNICSCKNGLNENSFDSTHHTGTNTNNLHHAQDNGCRINNQGIGNCLNEKERIAEERTSQHNTDVVIGKDKSKNKNKNNQNKKNNKNKINDSRWKQNENTQHIIEILNGNKNNDINRNGKNAVESNNNNNDKNHDEKNRINNTGSGSASLSGNRNSNNGKHLMKNELNNASGSGNREKIESNKISEKIVPNSTKNNTSKQNNKHEVDKAKKEKQNHTYSPSENIKENNDSNIGNIELDMKQEKHKTVRLESSNMNEDKCEKQLKKESSNSEEQLELKKKQLENYVNHNVVSSNEKGYENALMKCNNLFLNTNTGNMVNGNAKAHNSSLQTKEMKCQGEKEQDPIVYNSSFSNRTEPVIVKKLHKTETVAGNAIHDSNMNNFYNKSILGVSRSVEHIYLNRKWLSEGFNTKTSEENAALPMHSGYNDLYETFEKKLNRSDSKNLSNLKNRITSFKCANPDFNNYSSSNTHNSNNNALIEYFENNNIHDFGNSRKCFSEYFENSLNNSHLFGYSKLYGQSCLQCKHYKSEIKNLIQQITILRKELFDCKEIIKYRIHQDTQRNF